MEVPADRGRARRRILERLWIGTTHGAYRSFSRPPA
jgi:hypothetical protein